MTIKKCELCGNPITGKGNRFCSVKCRNRHNASQQKKQGETRKCAVCGNEFYIPPSEAKRRSALYCSYQCAGRAKTGENNPNYKDKIQRICQNCGQAFEAYPGKVKIGRAKYCTRECASEAQKVARVEIPCGNCGELLEITMARFQDQPQHFCSQKCYAESRIKAEEEKKSTVFKKCAICGTEFWARKYDKSKSGKRFCSTVCYAAWRSQNASVGFSSGKGGKRDDLNGLYVRSSWEANWARYLNWLKEQGEIIEWEYEPKIFWFEGIKRGSVSYTPDFRIENPDGSIEYHEIKGYMDNKSRVKLQRMKKYHPEINIIVIATDEYKAMEKRIKPFIANWE